jgi:uncharacterized protein YjbI with pentapeptide repeats
MSTAESLLSPDLIKLIGRPIAELQLNIPGGAGGAANVQALGGNQFLRAQLNAANASLARIYGFSFEGHYYDLTKPVIMLVHGPGEPITWPPAVGAPPPVPPAPAPTVDQAGEAVRDWDFSADLRYWEYEKADFSMRLDVTTGTLEQILLEAALAGMGGSYAGANVSGANVSGANVRGANLRGANVRGANVFGGANAWGRNRGGDSG